MTKQSMFRLGVHGLPQAEAGLVRALVALAAQERPHFPWAFAAEGPYDAVIAGAPAPGLERLAPRLALLGNEAAPAASGMDRLQRPLRGEQLGAWLRQLEADMTPAAVAPARAAPAAARLAPEPAFQLRRWPPQAVLRGDPAHLRMAALLARRGAGARQLAARCGVADDVALDFLRELGRRGLLGPAQALAAGVRPAGVAAGLRCLLQA